jgi:3-phenylpropionate/trans-cinnamate dioxygenase ferredoxin reductase subunit
VNAGIVIVGAGQAGAQLAVSLREARVEGSITIIGDEPFVPYHRPPLSKDYMSEQLPETELLIRTEDFYRQHGIDVITETRASAIARADQEVLLASGRSLPYSHLILATGARNRRLPFEGGEPGNVHYLRTKDDADRLRTSLGSARSVLIIGAGFIGLEFATAARAAGAQVTVVEMAERVMGRAVSPETAEYFAARHRNAGATVLCGTAIDEFLRDASGKVSRVRIGDAIFDVDLVLVGIGVIPNDELAAEAGLLVDNGVIVDHQLRTSDPHISAIGDVARHPRPDTTGLVRVESVQNAADQARFLASRLAGTADRYDDTPWFWSHQAGDKLQIAGLAEPTDGSIVLGDRAAEKFSVCRVRNGFLVAVESVNSPGDHLASRKLLSQGPRIAAEQLHENGFSLRTAHRTAPTRIDNLIPERTPQ